MIKNKNLKMISNRLDELITSDFISFNKDNMFKDVELCIDVPKMYYEINTGSLDGFNINNILSDDNYLPKYESLLHVDNFILENNPQSVADFKGGKDKALGFLVGQAMKETKGKANPQMLNKMLKKELSK